MALEVNMARKNERKNDELRKYKINRFFQQHPAGSAMIEMGKTKVICAATVEDRVPGFLKGTGEGWLTAEYSLLPSATHTRTSREAARGKQTGRTQEIQRLIGRSLRSVMVVIRYSCDMAPPLCYSAIIS